MSYNPVKGAFPAENMQLPLIKKHNLDIELYNNQPKCKSAEQLIVLNFSTPRQSHASSYKITAVKCAEPEGFLIEDSESPDMHEYKSKCNRKNVLLKSCLKKALSEELKTQIRVLETLCECIYSQKFECFTPTLKASQTKKTLVLDLDETLIKAMPQLDKKLSNETVPITTISWINQMEIKTELDFFVRPGTQSFLRNLSPYYDIVIFSSSMRKYAEAVTNFLDPCKCYISAVLSRENCRHFQGIHVKDLRIFSGLSMENVVIVDNSIPSFALQLENGICIPSFQGNKDDTELAKICDFLIGIANVQDVRPFVKEFAGINSLIREYLEN